MRMISTRAASPPVGLAEALLAGLTPDGGLYIPEILPRLRPTDFDGAEDLPQIAERLLAPFFTGQALAAELPAICREALDLPLPLLATKDPRIRVLELFHGPSAAFKDFGARFLAAAMRRLRAPGADQQTVLVATSGDTGSAVAAAFHRQPGFRVVILFPRAGVSPRQAHLLSCFGDNVESYAVDGSFDDCQALAKAAFADRELRARRPLVSANSISLGRLLPQMAYYAQAALEIWRGCGAPAHFVVPTGNLGNGLACLWARAMGLPIGQIRLACNANHAVVDYLTLGRREGHASVSTLANAMDVGRPSNLERLAALGPERRAGLAAGCVDDATIRATIVAGPERYGQIWCPHTACAIALAERAIASEEPGPWIVAATAHPAKFETVVEPLIGQPVPIPSSLAPWLTRPAEAQPLAADYPALRKALLAA